jgi:ribosomal protein L22
MADEKDPKDVETEVEAAPAKKPRVRRKPKAEPEAAAGAAPEETAAPADEPVAEEPAADEEPAAVEEPAAEEAAKPAARSRSRAKAADAEPEAAEATEGEPKPKRRPSRRKAQPDKPAATAPARKRAPRDYGDTPPMVRAHAKYVRTSARKARLVCDHIRGKSVEEARAILAHANRDVARDWSKLLESAVANAEHNHELIGDELRIHAVKADEGPTLKRFRPRAMGRATKIRKRTSHLSITLTPKDGE